MMTLKDKNLDALKKYRFQFYERYIEVSEQSKSDDFEEKIELIHAKDETTIFVVEKNGKKLRLNSQYRPIQEAEKWADGFKTDNIMINTMMFGLGNGIFAKELLKRLKNDAKLFIYEPSLKIFKCAMQNSDLVDIIRDGRVVFCVQKINMEKYKDYVQSRAHWTSAESQICCHHTGYDILFPAEYKGFIEIIKKTNDIVQVNKNTLAHFSEKMVTNMLMNLKYIKNSKYISDYVGVFPENLPAIIVAAGPSLDKNIEELKRAKGKAFILAVDTAMRVLLKNNIIPDAMVTLDAGKPFEYMNNPALCDIPLFCMLESNHEIMEFHSGVKIWFDGGSFLGKIFARHNKVFTPYNTGGSVATGAFAVCISLQFKRIILVGQDLAYEGDITHAGGEISHVYNEETGIRFIEGIDGRPIKTRQDWIIYLQWFEDAIQTFLGKIDVIDATEGGALIHGSKIMTLHEVVDKYCVEEFDCNRALRGIDPVFNGEEYKSVRNEISNYLTEAAEMQRKAKEAIIDCDKILKGMKRHSNNKNLAKWKNEVLQTIREIEKYNIYWLVDVYLTKTSNKYLEGIFVVNNDKEKDELEIFRNTRMIFMGITEGIQKLMPYLEKSVSEI